MMQKITNKQAPAEALAPKGSQPANASSELGKASAAKSTSEKKAFDAELTQAGQAAAAQAQAQAAQAQAPQGQSSATPTVPTAPTEGNAGKAVEKAATPVPFAADSAKAPEKQGLLATSAERSPQTLKAATSSTTVSALTGLKPWSRDWVFEGEPPISDAPKPGSAPVVDKTLKTQAPATPNTRSLTEPTMASLLASPNAAQAAQGAQGTPAKAGTALSTPQNAPEMSAELSALMASLSQMEGDLDELEDSIGTAGSAKPGSTPALGGKVRPQTLSGAEFLSTLNAVKGKPESANLQAQRGGIKQPPMGDAKGFSVIEGGALKPRKNVLDDLSAAQYSNTTAHAAQTKAAPILKSVMPEVAGQVTIGANAENRLSSEALGNVTGALRGMTAQGGGEMRIRLKPENLGELHVRVVTDGKNVGLHIQASDDRSKKIIEESISHLKESLAGQSLSLASVDLSVANTPTGFGAFGDNPQSQAQSYFGQTGDQQQQNPYAANQGFQDGQGSRQGSGRYGRDTDGGYAPGIALASGVTQATSQRAAARGGIDVQA